MDYEQENSRLKEEIEKLIAENDALEDSLLSLKKDLRQICNDLSYLL